MTKFYTLKSHLNGLPYSQKSYAEDMELCLGFYTSTMNYTFIQLFTAKKEKSEELKLESKQLYTFFLILVSFTPFHPSISPNAILSCSPFYMLHETDTYTH